MAGNPQTKAKLVAAEERVRELEQELAGYRAANAPKREHIRRREYDSQVVDELLRWSGDGQFLEEMLATWCIDEETFQRWCEDHDELREVLGMARARAKGSLMRELRQALKTRTAFPVALAERIIKMIDADRAEAAGGADTLVRVHVERPAVTADAPAQARANSAADPLSDEEAA